MGSSLSLTRPLARCSALIIRAIGVLEGIALVGNPDFAIVDEAYPYIAKRLLTDPSPKMKEALRYMIYGKEGVFDAERLIDILLAFETFATNSRSAMGDYEGPAPAIGSTRREAGEASTSAPSPGPPSLFPVPAFGAGPLLPFPAPGQSGVPLFPFPVPNPFGLPMPALAGSGFPAAPAAAFGSDGLPQDGRAREALKFMFSEEGRFFREFLMDELVRSIDALSRDQARLLAEGLGLEGAMVPILLPGARPFVPLVPSVSDEDRKVVANVTKIANFLAGGDASRLLQAADPRMAQELLPFLPAVANEILPELVQRLSSRIAARAVRELYAFADI